MGQKICLLRKWFWYPAGDGLLKQLFKEGKSYLGMSDYEVRSYTGWHRHMSLVFLVMHFLLKCRIEFGQKKTL